MVKYAAHLFFSVAAVNVC